MEAMEQGVEAKTMWSTRRGGFRAAMFMFATTALDNVGFLAILTSLVLYFMGIMHFNLHESANTLTNFVGATFLLTIVGGFISDTYMTRLNTVLMFGFLEITGYVLLILQAHFQDLQPDASCLLCKVEGRNAKLFYISLSLMALGLGGVRGALPSLGADQFDRNDPKERAQLASFFNYFLLSITVGSLFGVTVIVWISTVKGAWDVSFLILMLLALTGFAVLAAGKPFYRPRVPGNSPLLTVLRVVVVAIRNRRQSLPRNVTDLYEINQKEDVDEERIPSTNQFRFLDKAAVPVSVSDTISGTPWKICSVTEVEQVKILIRMLPILASTVLMNTCLAQLQTFSVQQGVIMDRKLGAFTIPPASTSVIPFIFMALLIPVYEHAFVPLARRLTGNPSGITHLQRIAVGLVLAISSMSVAAAIEVKRRDAFNRRQEQISIFWLAFQYGLFGVADLFTFVGLTEFFYTEAAAGMRSLSTSFSFLSLSFGYFLSSVLVQIVDSVSARLRGNRQGWLAGLDLNKNRLDLFYWFLAALSCVNLGVYVLCAKWYKYRVHGAVVDGPEDQTNQISGVSDRSKIEKSTDKLLT